VFILEWLEVAVSWILVYAHALLSPLLALRPPHSPLLHKALAACHAVLGSLTNLVQVGSGAITGIILLVNG